VASDNRQEEISDSEWVSTDDGEGDREEISSCDSFSAEEMDDQPCSSASANYFIPKTEKWQTTPFANNSGRAAAHNVIRQSPGPTRLAKSQCSEDVTLYFCRLLFEKTYVSGLITEPQCLVAHGNPWMMKNSKFFLA